MTGLDYAVIAIIALSALLGWWRGLVYEVLSLAGWLAAWVVARLFAERAASYMPEGLGAETVRLAAAYAALFIATLIVSGIVAWLLSKAMKWVGLGWLDKGLGVLFGLLRGMLVVLVLALLAGMTSIPQQAFWREAWSASALEKMALFSRGLLPDNVAQRVTFPARDRAG